MMLAPKRVSPALSMCVLLALATASFLMSVPTAEAQKDYACTAGSKMVCFATPDPVLCAELESQINGMGKLQWPIPPGAVNPKQHFNCTDIVPQSMPGPMPGAEDGKYFCLDIEIDTGYNNRVKGAWGLTGNKAFLEKYTASKPLMLSFQCSMGNAMPVSSNNAVGTWYPLAVGVPDVQPDDYSNILPGPDGTRTNLIMNVGADIKAADAGKHRKLNWYPSWKASIPRLDVNIRFYFQDFVGSGILVEPTVKLPSSFPNASYVTFVAPYLKSDFADAYLDGSDSISAGVTDFVTAGGVLVVFASTKSAMPYSQVCAAPLALMNAVLGDTGCSCQLDNIYDGVPIVPVANVDTDIAEAIFTTDSYNALVNASSDVLLDVGLVGGVPLDCSGGVEGSNLMPVFAEDQDSGELTSTGLGLTRVWSLGNGYVIYAGAAVTPEANIFSSNSTWANRDVWRQLLRSIARMPVPPQDDSPLAK